MKTVTIDKRRHLALPGNKEATIAYCIDHLIDCYRAAVHDHGFFSLALSGGSTPKAIYGKLALSNEIDWSKVHLFFSDERSVPPTDPDSNYKMALDSGFTAINPPHMHRMIAEKDMPQNALAYEKLIERTLKGRPFDYIMLGMGEDGHTASLFPNSDGLEETKRLVVPNYAAPKKSWRMTFTFPLINSALHTVIYVIGEDKAPMLASILNEKSEAKLPPSGRVGTALHPALWIADDKAAKLMKSLGKP